MTAVEPFPWDTLLDERPTVAEQILEAGPYDAVDLCAGPGGWDVAAEALGLRVLGFEISEPAIATRKANGHDTVEIMCPVTKAHPRGVRGVSITEAVLDRYRFRGQIASPPCQGFSLAGKGKGRDDSVLLLERLEHVHTLADLEREIAYLHDHMTDDRTLLVLEPLRWLLTNLPEWFAWEQVATVQPIWDACARIAREHGYSVATGVVTAEMYGVPQTRRRAVVLGRSRRMTAALGEVALPTPTHSRYHNRTPDKLDEGVRRWVSMAEGIEWGLNRRPAYTITGGSKNGSSGVEWGSAAVRESLHDARESGDVARWEPREGDPGWGMTHRPYPTIAAGVGEGGGHDPQMLGGSGARKIVARERDEGRWIERDPDGQGRIRNQSGTPYDVEAQIATPATALAGRNQVSFRGPNANRFNGSTKSRNDGIRITLEEAAALQTFPADYTWCGNKGERFQQVGDAVPPQLAFVLLATVVGLPFVARPAGGS